MPSSRSSARWLAVQVTDTSPRGLASTVADLIRHGELAAGAQLPTVRDLAQELGVSPATVSQAWSLLRKRGTVTGRGRAGIWVTNPDSVRLRVEQVGHLGDRLRWDLAPLVPDTALLPDLREALASATSGPNFNTYVREPIITALQDEVRARWPFAAESFLTANSGTDGLYRALRTLTVPGDRVAVENPTSSPLLRILADLEVLLVPVGCDQDGPLPDQLSAALRGRPAVFVYQPRAQVPAGHVVSSERVEALAARLRGRGAITLEYDDVNELSAYPAASIGRQLPGQTVLLRSYSKAYGPELRTAVLGGARAPITDMHSRLTMAAQWTSRILQSALAWLLADESAQRTVARARVAYVERRETVSMALARHGVVAANRDGLGLWIPVWDERVALATLAAEGLTALAGSSAYVEEGPPRIRLATSRVTGEVPEIAAIVARAARRPA